MIIKKFHLNVYPIFLLTIFLYLYYPERAIKSHVIFEEKIWCYIFWGQFFLRVELTF